MCDAKISSRGFAKGLRAEPSLRRALEVMTELAKTPIEGVPEQTDSLLMEADEFAPPGRPAIFSISLNRDLDITDPDGEHECTERLGCTFAYTDTAPFRGSTTSSGAVPGSGAGTWAVDVAQSAAFRAAANQRPDRVLVDYDEI